MTRNPTAGLQWCFHASLEPWAQGLDYCAVPVPADVTQALGTTGPVLVMARVNASPPFQVSLFPVGGGRHYIRIKARVRQQTNTKAGDQVQLHITVLDRAAVTIPDDLAGALQAGQAADAFQRLPPGKKNFLIRRIAESARPETRNKRIQEAIQAARQRQEKLGRQA